MHLHVNKSLTTIMFFAFLLICILNCAHSNKDFLRNAPPNSELPVEAGTHQSGSLWPGENIKNNLFVDNKAKHLNDIVTVVVSETSTGTSAASTNTSRDSTTAAGIVNMLGMEKSVGNSNENLKSNIKIGGTASNSLKGKGDTSRQTNFSTRITARVMKVMDNGNLFIEGRRQLTMNGEEQYIVLSGIIRAEDITADNLIASQYISDARIYYTGDGVINDKMRPGWLTRVMDVVWPF